MKLLEMIDALGSPFDRDTAAHRVSRSIAMGSSGDQDHGGAGFTQGVANPLGGHTVFQNGVAIGGDRASPLGGTDFLDAHGMIIGHVGASPLGGHTITDGHGMHAGHIGASPLGGFSVSDAHGMHVAHAGVSPLGGVDITGAHGLHHITPDGHGGWSSNDT
jgi:hypothetical protein